MYELVMNSHDVIPNFKIDIIDATNEIGYKSVTTKHNNQSIDSNFKMNYISIIQVYSKKSTTKCYEFRLLLWEQTNVFVQAKTKLRTWEKKEEKKVNNNEYKFKFDWCWLCVCSMLSDLVKIYYE